MIFWDFKIQPEDEQYATDIRRPIRTFADGKTSLASVTKICLILLHVFLIVLFVPMFR